MLLYYEIPPSRKIADTGDVLNDYEPAKVYIPRRYYRNARVAPQDNHWANEVPSIKSTPYAFDINYNMGPLNIVPNVDPAICAYLPILAMAQQLGWFT